VAARSVRQLSASELEQLTWGRLDAYRKKLLALQESAAASDLDGEELAQLDATRLHFKDDPVWRETHDVVVALLARMPAPSIPKTVGSTDSDRRSHGGSAPTERPLRGSAGPRRPHS
jgi:hypothetical protein